MLSKMTSIPEFSEVGYGSDESDTIYDSVPPHQQLMRGLRDPVRRSAHQEDPAELMGLKDPVTPTITSFTPKKFLLCGCPHSLEQKVVVLVQKRHLTEQCQLDLEPIEAQIRATGIAKPLDLILVAVDPHQQITMSYPPQDHQELHLLLQHTTSKYIQQHHNFVKPMDLAPDFRDRMHRAMEQLNQKMGSLIELKRREEYQRARAEVGETRTERYEFLSQADQYLSPTSWYLRDASLAWSEISFQICLAIAQQANFPVWTRVDLWEPLNSLFDSRTRLLMGLMLGGYNLKGEEIHFSPTDWASALQLLFQQCRRLIGVMKIGIDWQEMKFEEDLYQNPSALPEAFYDEFLRSPLVPSDRFLTQLGFTYQGHDLNRFFQIRSEGKVPTFAHSKIIWIDLRSKKWCQEFKKYQVMGAKMIGKGNLHAQFPALRDCLIEMMVLQKVKFHLGHGVETFRAIPGFLVETPNKKKSRAVCPSLLLSTEDTVVPLIIKFLGTSQRGSEFYQAKLEEAQGELQRSLSILGRGTRGMVAFIYTREKDPSHPTQKKYPYQFSVEVADLFFERS